jgi:fructoselysine-6-P-deglycase FrlB-like protein
MTTAYEHFWQEITEQPQVLAALLALPQHAFHWFEPNVLANAKHIVVVAEGSSKNAMQLACNVMRPWTDHPFDVLEGREALALIEQKQTVLSTAAFWRWLSEDTLWVLVSQSGATGSLLAVMDALQQDPEVFPPWVLITNTEDSPLAERCPTVIQLNAGVESAIPATKTVSATVMATMLWLTQNARALSTLRAPYQPIPAWMTEWFKTAQQSVAPVVHHLLDAEELIIIADTSLSHILPELRLKWVEVLGIPVHIDTREAFKHGHKVLLARTQTHNAKVLYLLNGHEPFTLLIGDLQQHLINTHHPQWVNLDNIHAVVFGQAHAEPLPDFLQNSAGSLWQHPIQAPFLLLGWLHTVIAEAARIKQIPINHPALTKFVPPAH